MAVDTEYFEKFIIRKVVDTVRYNAREDEYIINRIHISDDLLREIEMEGVKYGLSSGDSRGLFSNIVNNIRISPSVKINYARVTLFSMKPGQHLELFFHDENTGEQTLELLYLGDLSFSVLSSSLAGFNFNDEIISLANHWNNSFFIDFILKREGKRYPTETSIVKIGRLMYVKVYSPSYIHAVLDSQKSFVKEEQDAKSDVPYVWTPCRTDPVAFSWQKTDLDRNATFIITDIVHKKEARLKINRKFSFPDDINKRDYLLKTILSVCLVKWDLKPKGFETHQLKYIKCLKAGILKYDTNSKEKELWILKEKPIIKFVYYE